MSLFASDPQTWKQDPKLLNLREYLSFYQSLGVKKGIKAQTSRLQPSLPGSTLGSLKPYTSDVSLEQGHDVWIAVSQALLPSITYREKVSALGNIIGSPLIDLNTNPVTFTALGDGK
jgi:hypothetical protein